MIPLAGFKSMKKLLLLFAASAVFVVGCGDKSDEAGTTTGTASNTPAGTEKPAGGETGYAAVQSVFTKNCVGCHGANNPKAGINLTSYETVMRGGTEGPIVKAGDPAGSVIIQALHGTDHKKQMPPKGALPADQIGVIESWIKDGAKA
jgi:mono/diheme cytochrome c family protein